MLIFAQTQSHTDTHTGKHPQAIIMYDYLPLLLYSLSR